MTTISELRKTCEQDLYSFATLLCPRRMFGQLHIKAFAFLMEDDIPNALMLLPRAHQKSFVIAVYVLWRIVRKPTLTCLYISATSTLAETQLSLIKTLLTSPIFRRYWPSMIDKDEKSRSKWNATSISVDHPDRQKEQIRDATIITAGLTTNTTGLHCDLIIADDVVVPENAYTQEGRRKVSSSMSQMASILNPGGSVKAVGTRYHPSDQYQVWMDQVMDIFDDDVNVIGKTKVWSTMSEVVEEDGVFLWPRTIRGDGAAFGFDHRELARIKSMYTDRLAFFAQYYNNPNSTELATVTQDSFQYYNQKYVKRLNNNWYFKNSRMNVYAAQDYAYSMNNRADYTTLVVIGVTSNGFIYVLDIDRFKTNIMNEYFECVLRMHSKWLFKKLRVEVTAAQSLIVSDIKEKVREHGLPITLDEFKPTRHLGSKEERMSSILDHRYQNKTIFHYRGGFTPVLEEEVLLPNSAHDDVIDSLANAIAISVKPKDRKSESRDNVVRIGSGMRGGRFGGRNSG